MLETSFAAAQKRSSQAEEERLLSRIRACARRAADTGRPALLRLHLVLSCPDPWCLWEGHGATAPFFALNDGRAGLCTVGWGHLQECMLPASARFNAARNFCSRLLEQVVDVQWSADTVCDVDAPLAFAGFAFGDEAAADVWADWQGGSMVVPKFLAYQRANEPRCRIVINSLVPADVDAPELLAALNRDLESLQARQRVTSLGVGDAAQVQLVEDRLAWIQRVQAARSAVNLGVLGKVVLARAADFTAPAGTRFDPVGTAWALRRDHPGSVCFAIGRVDGSSFVGASPEILVQVSGRSLLTQAVAGTAPRGGSKASDDAFGKALVDSDKDRREHAFVADVLAAALEPLCVELRRPAEPRVIVFPRVQHLETPFAGTLRQAGGVLQLVEQLHPTPSVGGWPAAAALQWLHEQEPLERGWYAGPVGWLTAAGDGAFAVAIRSVWMRGARARAFAGAGIVAASDPAAEWQETELKLQTVRDALQLAHES